jgi:hypothetical protein
MKLKEGISVDVTDARWVSGYLLEISFSDGFSHKVDFESFLSEAIQPEIREYLDAEKFKAFSISFGNLVWNDYDMCFSIEDLYSGSINAFEQSQSMVAENELEYRTDRKNEG